MISRKNLLQYLEEFKQLNSDFSFVSRLGKRDNFKRVNYKVEDQRSELIFYNFTSFEKRDNLRKQNELIEDNSFIFNDSYTLDGFPSYISISSNYFNLFKAFLAKKVYPIVDGIKFIAFTGTNGKTTCVHLMRSLLVEAGKKVISFGTEGFFVNHQLMEDFGLTTPDVLTFYSSIAEYADRESIEVVLFEFSSHSLEQKRLGDIQLDAGGWTNLTQDHLDYHLNMENYFQAKALILKHLKKNGLLFFSESAQVEYDRLKANKNCRVNKTIDGVKIPQQFRDGFNFQNLNLCLNIYTSVFGDLPFENLNFIENPPGRYEEVIRNNTLFIIDYAHTPDALENLLLQVKKNNSSKKVCVVFGCGGDRDKAKRSLMGDVAGKNADFVIVTSDNPRFEDPLTIIDDIQKSENLSKANSLNIVDRKEAIISAYQDFSGEVVVIAGKGNENYIDLKGVKTPYSDRSVVNEL